MLNKYIIAKPSGVGTAEYWSGTSQQSAWGSLMGAKQFNSEESAMTAFCGGSRFAGKVTKDFANSVAAACRKHGAIEISILKIEAMPTKKFTISAERNFPL